MEQESQQATEPTVADKTMPEKLDFENLPPLPWTVENLGFELYCQIAIAGGYIDPTVSGGQTPDLCPRSFASGVCYKKIGELLAPLTANLQPARRKQIQNDIIEGRAKDFREYCLDDEAYEAVCAALKEREALQQRVTALVGATKPTARKFHRRER